MSSDGPDVQRQQHPSDGNSTAPTGGSFATGAIGYLFVALTAGFFGSAPTFARLAFDGGMDPVGLQVLRFAITFSAVLAVALLIARPSWRLTKAQIGRLVVMGISSGVLSICYMTSVRYIQVGLASLIFFCFPIIVGVLTHFLGEERLTRRRALAILVAFAGLTLVLGGNIGRPDPIGVALAVVAGCGVALNFLLAPPLTRAVSPLVLTLGTTGLPFLFYGAFAALRWESILPSTSTGWIGVVGNGLCYAGGLACLYATIRRLGPVRTAVFLNAEPLVSVLVAFLILGELLAPPQFLGAAVVLLGVLLMQWDRFRQG